MYYAYAYLFSGLVGLASVLVLAACPRRSSKRDAEAALSQAALEEHCSSPALRCQRDAAAQLLVKPEQQLPGRKHAVATATAPYAH